jgi:hypothetical protein
MIPVSTRYTVDSYVQKLKEDPEIIGVFLVGSYATGQYSELSDIDIKIILQPNIQKHYKGVKVEDGFHISYSAYSVMEAYDYFYTQLRSYSKFQARMLSQGIILYDATGEMKHLQAEANLVMQMPFVKPALSSIQLEAYSLWKYKDALMHNDLQLHTLQTYHVFLDKALILYTKLLDMECIFQYPFFKMEQYIHDANFRKKYEIPEFPDTAFLQAYEEGLKHTAIQDIQQTVYEIFRSIEAFLQIDFEAFEIRN